MPSSQSFARAGAAIAVVAALAACGDQQSFTAPRDAAAVSADAAAAGDVAGAVYTSTNAAGGNEVVAFARTRDGGLLSLGSFATGGVGIGGTVDPLASQYAVILSSDHRRLYAVNAGSNDVSVFEVGAAGTLHWMQRVGSGGVTPVSLALGRDRLYVLNTGDATVGTLRVSPDGLLSPVPGGVRSLPAGASGASTVGVLDDARTLVVTERNTNRIDLFPIDRRGALGDGSTIASHGAVPFGFDKTPGGLVVVSEAGAGALSSYEVRRGTHAELEDGSVSTGGAAPCWVRIDRRGRFVYTTNTGTSTIAGFVIRGDGRLHPLAGGGIAATLAGGSIPLDFDISAGGRFLFTLNAGTGGIGAFAIQPDGALSALTGASGAVGPASGAQGLAAF